MYGFLQVNDASHCTVGKLSGEAESVVGPLKELHKQQLRDEWPHNADGKRINET